MTRLEGKVAIVTGAARGIGKQIALTFAQEGASVAIGDVLDMEKAVEEIRAMGGKVVAVKADVTRRDEVKKLVESTVQSLSRIDILVNNAGHIRRGKVQDMTEEDWDIVVDIDLKGPFLCIQAVASYLIGQKYGKIVNIASIAGFSAKGVPAHYVAAKTGLIGLTRAAARDLGPYGINVNAIAPGTIITDLTYTARNPEQHIAEAAQIAVLGRAGTPQDIANVALFLASDESSFITGQVIVVDGGRVGIVS